MQIRVRTFKRSGLQYAQGTITLTAVVTTRRTVQSTDSSKWSFGSLEASELKVKRILDVLILPIVTLE